MRATGEIVAAVEKRVVSGGDVGPEKPRRDAARERVRGGESAVAPLQNIVHHAYMVVAVGERPGDDHKGGAGRAIAGQKAGDTRQIHARW